MDVHRGLASLPLEAEGTVVTVGFFDGVHRGHAAVLGRTVEVARQRALPSVAVTFDRHPREVLTPGHVPALLTTLERKTSLIDGLGLDHLVVLEFTEEFSRWSPLDFVRRVLAEGLRARHAVVGANFTFGYRAAGTLESLVELGTPLGLSAEGVALFEIGGRAVSSSSIREALAAGDLEWPEVALGRRYVVDGTVVPGAGRGRGLGWPTANLEVPRRLLLPARGVYAGMVDLGAGQAHVAAINVGSNPTFGDEPLHVEAFLLDFQGELLGRSIGVEFWARLRDEVVFGSSDELARQIGEDVRRTRELVPGSATRR
jgi:riboflavin kinase / FMN adenylyltransferase